MELVILAALVCYALATVSAVSVARAPESGAPVACLSAFKDTAASIIPTNPGNNLQIPQNQLTAASADAPTIALSGVNVNVPVYVTKVLEVEPGAQAGNKTYSVSQRYTFLLLSIIVNLIISVVCKKYRYRGMIPMFKDVIAMLVLVFLKLFGSVLALNRQSHRPLALMYGGAAPAIDC